MSNSHFQKTSGSPATAVSICITSMKNAANSGEQLPIQHVMPTTPQNPAWPSDRKTTPPMATILKEDKTPTTFAMAFDLSSIWK